MRIGSVAAWRAMRWIRTVSASAAAASPSAAERLAASARSRVSPRSAWISGNSMEMLGRLQSRSNRHTSRSAARRIRSSVARWRASSSATVGLRMSSGSSGLKALHRSSAASRAAAWWWSGAALSASATAGGRLACISAAASARACAASAAMALSTAKSVPHATSTAMPHRPARPITGQRAATGAPSASAWRRPATVIHTPPTSAASASVSVAAKWLVESGVPKARKPVSTTAGRSTSTGTSQATSARSDLSSCDRAAAAVNVADQRRQAASTKSQNSGSPIRGFLSASGPGGAIAGRRSTLPQDRHGRSGTNAGRAQAQRGPRSCRRGWPEGGG